MSNKTPARQSDKVPYAGFGWRSAQTLVSGHLPRCLVDEEEKAALFAFAKELPGSWYWGMFEVRLQADETRVDLLAALVQSPLTRAQIRETFSSGGHAALDSARGTLEAWSDNGNTHFVHSPNLWFEWDHDRPKAPALQWLCLAPDFFDKTQSGLAPAHVVSLAEEFLASAPGLEVAGATQMLSRLARSLPDRGKLMSFSSLKPRGREACRVFARIPRGKLRAWLSSIGWEGNSAQLQNALPHFEVEGEDHFCQLEFGEKLGPYLGLELAQTERGFPRRQAREQWLQHAVAQGWTNEEKANAVLNWHGATPCSLPNTPPIKQLRSFHLKLALLPDKAPEAKAYLGFYFRKSKQTLAA